MKVIIIFSLLTATSISFANEISLGDIAGVYSITHPELPVENLVELSDTGEVFLIEESPFGDLTCEGNANISSGVLESVVECGNGVSFTQSIDFSEVDEFTNFQAPVFSTLYGIEMIMNFERLDD